jgi:hypothetical protein
MWCELQQSEYQLKGAAYVNLLQLEIAMFLK